MEFLPNFYIILPVSIVHPLKQPTNRVWTPIISQPILMTTTLLGDMIDDLM